MPCAASTRTRGRREPAFRNGGDAFEIEAAFGSVWATNYGLGRVTRLDAQTGRAIASIPVRRDPKGIVAGGGSIWVVNSGDCSISRLLP